MGGRNVPDPETNLGKSSEKDLLEKRQRRIKIVKRIVMRGEVREGRGAGNLPFVIA